MSRRLAQRFRILAAVLAGSAVAGCGWGSKPAPLDSRQTALDALWALRNAGEDRDPFTRAKALEAMSQILGPDAGPVFAKALKDDSPVVRFAAAMAVGDVRYEPAKKTLLGRTAEGPGGEPDKRVFAGILYALHRLGDDTHTTQLGKLLFDEEKEVRANAAMAMGKMDIPAGKRLLKSLASDERDREGLVRLNALEALARLRDEPSIESLEAYLKWPTVEFQLVAIQALGEAGTPRAQSALRQLLQNPEPRVRVAAAGALARTASIDDRSFEYTLQAAQDPKATLRAARKKGGSQDSDSVSLQELSARALGEMKRPEAAWGLHPLLKSPNGGIRVAAAMSLLKLLPRQKDLPETQPTTKPTTRPVLTGAGPATRPAATSRPKVSAPTQPAQEKPARPPKAVPPGPAVAPRPVPAPATQPAGSGPAPQVPKLLPETQPEAQPPKILKIDLGPAEPASSPSTEPVSPPEQSPDAQPS